MIFSFGQAAQQRIEVDVHGYHCPASGEYWDDNCLTAEIRFRDGEFYGKAGSVISTETLAKALSGLWYQINCLNMIEPWRRVSAFSIRMEPQGDSLHCQLIGNGKGHVQFRCWFSDRGGGNLTKNAKLTTLWYDESQLRSSIHELESVISQFPPRVA
jgi:hypothetical protein